MQFKAVLPLVLAALFPAASYAAIRFNAPAPWLGLIDFLLVAILFIALSHDRQDGNAGKKSLALAMGALIVAALIFRSAPDLLVYAPAMAISLLLARLFHASLAPGREPVITRIARIERDGKLPAELQVYTRRLTWAWAFFFLAMAAECLILAAIAPVELYLLFANTLNYLFVAAFLIVEYVFRRLRYRHHPHPSPLRLIRSIGGGSMLAAWKKSAAG
jgi:uncharacterized membrane protein